MSFRCNPRGCIVVHLLTSGHKGTKCQAFVRGYFQLGDSNGIAQIPETLSPLPSQLIGLTEVVTAFKESRNPSRSNPLRPKKRGRNFKRLGKQSLTGSAKKGLGIFLLLTDDRSSLLPDKENHAGIVQKYESYRAVFQVWSNQQKERFFWLSQASSYWCCKRHSFGLGKTG